MKHLARIATLVALAASASLAAAQDAAQANAQRCQNLQAGVNEAMQDRLRRSVPKQDPSSFNQDGYDIKGIMSQDVTSGFGKLASLNFASLTKKLVDSGLQQAANRGASAFNNRMQGVLQEYGVKGVTFQGATVNTGGVLSGNGVQLGGGSVSVNPGVTAGLPSAVPKLPTVTTPGISSSIYSRQPVTPSSPQK